MFKSNFYRLSPEKQKREAFRRLLGYMKDCIYPYSPFYRGLFREMGIRPEKIKSYDDFRKIPIIKKAEYVKDPRSFILQPKVKGREESSLYETEYLSRVLILKYLFQALVNRPREYSHLFRRVDFREGKMGRRVALEWFPVHFHASGGTTGNPIPVVYTHRDISVILQEVSAQMLLLPDEPDPEKPFASWTTKNMNLFPGAPHLAFFQAVLTKLNLGMASFDTCGGKVIPTERQVELFSKGEFNMLNAIPSYLGHWMKKALEMQERGEISKMPHLKGAVVAAEPVSEDYRREIRELAVELGAHPMFRVIEGYGLTESKWAFLECDQGTGIHLNPKFWYWELLHPETLEPAMEGSPGILVFSHIDWRGTAFLRYNTGDLIAGGMVWDRCPACGYTFPRIRGPILRAERDFTKIKGVAVNFHELRELIRTTEGVDYFQVVIDREEMGLASSRDRVTVHFVPIRGHDPDRVSEKIRERMKGELEFSPDRLIHVEGREEFQKRLFERTGIKADYIIDRR